MNKDQQWLLDLLKNCTTDNFFGKLIIEVQGGQVTLARIEEVLKPPKSTIAANPNSR